MEQTKNMKTRKSNKLIDKLRAAWKDCNEDNKRQCEQLADQLLRVHSDCIAFLTTVNPPKREHFPDIPF